MSLCSCLEFKSIIHWNLSTIFDVFVIPHLQVFFYCSLIFFFRFWFFRFWFFWFFIFWFFWFFIFWFFYFLKFEFLFFTIFGIFDFLKIDETKEIKNVKMRSSKNLIFIFIISHFLISHFLIFSFLTFLIHWNWGGGREALMGGFPRTKTKQEQMIKLNSVWVNAEKLWRIVK